MLQTLNVHDFLPTAKHNEAQYEHNEKRLLVGATRSSGEEFGQVVMAVVVLVVVVVVVVVSVVVVVVVVLVVVVVIVVVIVLGVWWR